MTPSEVGRDFVAVLRKIPLVYYAATALGLATAAGWGAHGIVGVQTNLPAVVRTLSAKVTAVDQRVDSTNAALARVEREAADYRRDQKLTLCYVRALWAGETKPTCGLNGEER